ncbi:MAG: hypothetical protein R3C18_14415 [Planctomycetaceae bacterium]
MSQGNSDDAEVDKQSVRISILNKYLLILDVEHGMLHPRVDEFWSQIPDDDVSHASIMAAATEAWLQEFASYASQFQLTHAAGIRLFSDASSTIAAQVIQTVDRIRKRLAEVLWQAFEVKYDLTCADTVLLFSRHEDYISYYSHYLSEGEFASSGGVCIRNHISPHIVLPYLHWAVDQTLTHEFAHIGISPIPLPLWLEEGVVQVIESMLVPSASALQYNVADLIETKRYWRSRPLQSFWSGEAFFDVDAQEHAYRLSRVLVRTMLADQPRELARLVKTASYVDQGESAAQVALNMSLDQLAGTFLGVC